MLKSKYLMCGKPRKYKVHMYSRVGKAGAYSGTYVVYAPSSRKAIMKACMVSGVPSITCLAHCYYGGLISLSGALKYLKSTKHLGVMAYAC